MTHKLDWLDSGEVQANGDGHKPPDDAELSRKFGWLARSVLSSVAWTGASFARITDSVPSPILKAALALEGCQTLLRFFSTHTSCFPHNCGLLT